MKKEKITLKIDSLGKKISVIQGTPLKDIIQEFGVEFPCGGEGTCGSCKIKLISGDVKDPEKHDAINFAIDLEPGYRLSCLSELVEDLTIDIPQLESFILADNTVFSFTPKSGFGIAVDLGTSTIVAQLIDLSSGHVIDVATARNPQIGYGSDIMSRVAYGLTVDGKEKLKEIIRNEIFILIKTLSGERNISLEKIVIVGNSVMHHLFCGFDVQNLSVYPFEIENNDSIEYNSNNLGWDLLSKVKIIFVKPIASFIGSDILAGVIASGMHNSPHLTALVDLGTNGEIVIGNNEKILCASTAAGPAFEGANIKMGMSAMSGAISSVYYKNSEVQYHVIGNYDAQGICGSGLVDSVNVFLQNELIDYTGAIINGNDKLIIGGGVYLTQKDIREFQLAKGALAAGMQVLVNKLGKSLIDITRVHIAGGFGNFLDVKNVTEIGMLEVDAYRIHKLGNSALIGAKMLLYSDDYSFSDIISKIEHISLDADESFQDVFVEKMFFNLD